MSDDKRARIDEMQGDIGAAFLRAKAAHEFEGVGHLCRQACIALADAVHDYARHPAIDGTTLSKTDAKGRLEAFFAAELPGASNEAARRTAKATVDLANAVQHGEDKAPRDAALLVVMTNAVIDFTAIVAGWRDKPPQSIQIELVEQLAQARAETARWQEKYEGLAGFSAHPSIEDERFFCLKASRDVEVVGLDYCFDDGVCIVRDDSLTALRGNFRQGLDGCDVRVPINHSYVEATFWSSPWGVVRKERPVGALETMTILLRLRFRVGGVLMQAERKARIEHEIGSNVVRLMGR